MNSSILGVLQVIGFVRSTLSATGFQQILFLASDPMYTEDPYIKPDLVPHSIRVGVWINPLTASGNVLI